MMMRLPDSGSWLGSLLSGLGQPVTATADGPMVDNVDEAQVIAAIDAMVRGEIEYVILEEGEAFIQSAGEDRGPYQLQYCPDASGALFEVTGGVDRDTAQRVLLAYRRGDIAWKMSNAWTPLAG